MGNKPWRYIDHSDKTNFPHSESIDKVKSGKPICRWGREFTGIQFWHIWCIAKLLSLFNRLKCRKMKKEKIK
jgi:hypothetical protein